MANRALGIGEGLFPPARFATEHTSDYCIKQAKAIMQSMGKEAIAAGAWLISAKQQCTHGEWLAELEQFGVSPRTAQALMAKARANTAGIDDLLDGKCAESAHLEEDSQGNLPTAQPVPKEPTIYEPPPASEPEVEREPGCGDQEEAEEPYLKHVRVARELWPPRIDELAKTRSNAAAVAKRALEKFDAAFAEYSALAALPIKSGPPERGRCKACNAPVTWTFNKNGKREPLEDNGRSHYATCPARKK